MPLNPDRLYFQEPQVLCRLRNIIPYAFFGVLRTFFAKKVLSRRRQNRLLRFASRLFSTVHVAPPQARPKETFCKKSPLESRKTTFDFYILGFQSLALKVSKITAHAADFRYVQDVRLGASYILAYIAL